MDRKCAACGAKTNVVFALGGVLLCREHFQEVSARLEQMRREGKQGNAAGIAREMFREQYATGDYILRDIPRDVWNRAKHRAVDDGHSLRELVLKAVQEYLHRHDR